MKKKQKAYRELEERLKREKMLNETRLGMELQKKLMVSYLLNRFQMLSVYFIAFYFLSVVEALVLRIQSAPK